LSQGKPELQQSAVQATPYLNVTEMPLGKSSKSDTKILQVAKEEEDHRTPESALAEYQFITTLLKQTS
jgi:hypothetical protein